MQNTRLFPDPPPLVMSWACITTMSDVYHLCGGAGIRGGPSCGTGIASPISELYLDHTGTSVFFVDYSLDTGVFMTLVCVSVTYVLFTVGLVKLCARSQAKSCISTRMESSCVTKRPNHG